MLNIPPLGPGKSQGRELVRLVASTFNLQEAKQIADRFEVTGYDSKIVENKRGGIVLYEVWITRQKEGFEAKKDFLSPKQVKTD